MSLIKSKARVADHGEVVERQSPLNAVEAIGCVI